MQSDRAIVCDLGSGYMKMGFSGDNFPARTFPSIIGRPMLRSEQIIEDVQLKPVMIGDEVTKYRAILELSYPTTEGIVKNWDDMDLLLGYSFKSLGVDNMKGKSLMMTEAVMNPVVNRVKMAELLFEKYQIGRFQLGLQALMSLFAEAIGTALLLDSGDGVTHCIPVYDNYVLMNQIGRLNIAGRHITNHFTKLLHMQGYAFNSTADFEFVRELKEKYCFVSGDIKVDEKLSRQTTHHLKTHTLPDGKTVVVGKQRFMAPQILFNPMLAGFQYDNCSEMVFKSINECDISTRRDFYKNILISGGTTMFPGFPTRLRNEVEKLYKQRILKNSSGKGVEINVIDPPSRRYNVFIGASFVAKITAAQTKSWMNKADYDEKGARLVEELTYNVR